MPEIEPAHGVSSRYENKRLIKKRERNGGIGYRRKECLFKLPFATKHGEREIPYLSLSLALVSPPYRRPACDTLAQLHQLTDPGGRSCVAWNPRTLFAIQPCFETFHFLKEYLQQIKVCHFCQQGNASLNLSNHLLKNGRLMKILYLHSTGYCHYFGPFLWPITLSDYLLPFHQIILCSNP